MRHVRFRDPGGNVRRGEWTGRTGEEITTREAYGGRLAFGDETFDAADVDVLPPCEPTKIVCVGLNYAKHAEEQDSDIPDRPLLFLKPPNTVAAHGETVPLLAEKERIDYEAELGVVVGERCRNVAPRNVEDVIAGYTCVNDISNRDDQMIEQNWVRGKAFDNAAPLGPVIATPEEVPADARIRLWQNGDLRQDSSIDEFIFSVPELIAEITAYMTLEPGDVIATGTPEGVGPMVDGDTIAIEIEGVGTLEHRVRIP